MRTLKAQMLRNYQFRLTFSNYDVFVKAYICVCVCIYIYIYIYIHSYIDKVNIQFTATDQLNIFYFECRYLLIRPVSFPQRSNSNFGDVFVRCRHVPKIWDRLCDNEDLSDNKNICSARQRSLFSSRGA